MKIYFAGLSDEKLINDDTNILLSYLEKNKIAKLNKKIFLDSGAYSAFTRGKIINIEEYIQYIKDNLNHFEIYATLDVIGDWVKTKKNLKIMEEAGLKPLPTFHFGSPEKELKELIENYDYIALGGLVPYAKKRNKLKNWLDYCFSIIGTKAKTHGFGVNAYWAWERYPFYSVDATSWLKWSIFYTQNTVTNEQDLIKLYRRKNQTDLQRQKILLNEYLQKTKEITKLWESRGVKWN
jgi:hypothetical protein